MKKTINCKPVTEIELAFEEGKSIVLRFDLLALMNLKDMHELTTLSEEPLPEVCAMLIASSSSGAVTLEEARTIVSGMDLATVMLIMSEWSDALGVAEDEATKKLTAQFLNQVMSK